MPGGGASGRGRCGGGFEAARAGVVPPPLIAENRAQLATLVATNFMGFNTPAIVATKLITGRCGPRTPATMYGFAGQAAGITGSLVPFTPRCRTLIRWGWPRNGGVRPFGRHRSPGSTP